jgi:hypothetical protein
MKRLMILLLGAMTAGSTLNAQQTTSPVQVKDGAVIQFETTDHSFGKINEEKGPVSYTFKFKNTGNKPLTITNVQPSCGCTTPDWTKSEIAPGKEGFVKATYDVNNRPGSFHKSITVYANTDPNIMLLTFSGEVIPRPKTITDSFPYQMGNLRLEMNHVNFGIIYNNSKDTTQYLNIVNTGTKPITIKDFKTTVSHITSKGAPMTIQPNERKKFPIQYHGNKVQDYGVIFDQVKLLTDDDKDPDKTISVIAEIKQYIAPMTDAEKAKAPKIFFPETLHDFGTIKEGESVTTEFAFTNKGKSDLIIYKVKTSCGCTASQPEKTKLKAGETSNIKVTFNSTGKEGKEEKHITVYTNDPTKSESDLVIKSNVVTSTDQKQ